MIHWNCNKDYIIELCFENIMIYDLIKGNIYQNFNEEFIYYYTGFISYDNKYLYTSSNQGKINIWDLQKKLKIYEFIIKSAELFKILPWSIEILNIEDNMLNGNKYNIINNYVLVADRIHKGFYCICISFKKEVIDKNKHDSNKDLKNNINHQILSFYNNGKTIKYIKGIIHPIYGESLISSNDDRDIDLWVNNNGF